MVLIRNRNRNLSKVGTGTVTFHKSEPEPWKIVTVPQHCLSEWKRGRSWRSSLAVHVEFTVWKSIPGTWLTRIEECEGLLLTWGTASHLHQVHQRRLTDQQTKWTNYYCISVLRIRLRLKHFRLIANSDPVPVFDSDPGFWWSKIEKNVPVQLKFFFILYDQNRPP
jgi:hypothetical protein